MLCQCLDKITQINPVDDFEERDQMSINQIDQIKIFNKYLINLAIQKTYVVERLDDMPEEDEDLDFDDDDIVRGQRQQWPA